MRPVRWFDTLTHAMRTRGRSRLTTRDWVLVLLCTAVAVAAATPDDPCTPPGAQVQIDGYQTRSIEGWTVHVNAKLLAEQSAQTNKAIELLTAQLKEIVRVVPAPAVGHLRQVPLWINPEYPGKPPGAEYHPDAGWLREHGRDARMAKCVEFTNVRIFPAECRRMPCFVLHELAHAYHDQVLGFDDPDIIAAYKHAAASKKYDAVERFNGEGPNTVERAYAMTNYKEYFAESTEAFFGRNDFFPFTRDQLRSVDPEMFNLLARLWGVPGAATKPIDART